MSLVLISQHENATLQLCNLFDQRSKLDLLGFVRKIGREMLDAIPRGRAGTVTQPIDHHAVLKLPVRGSLPSLLGRSPTSRPVDISRRGGLFGLPFVRIRLRRVCRAPWSRRCLRQRTPGTPRLGLISGNFRTRRSFRDQRVSALCRHR